MAASTSAVSLHLKHHIDADGEYGAFTSVNADILLNSSKIGSIEATLVNRSNIPSGYFLAACDGHSQSLQYVGCILYEPKLGRSILKSLTEYDRVHPCILYIDLLRLDDAHKTTSDMATEALHQFLHHPFLRSKVSSAVYIMDPTEAMSEKDREDYEAESIEKAHAYMMDNQQPSPETDDDRRAKLRENERMDALARKDAIPFLRNGFFQDAAIARLGEDRHLVASQFHWSSKPILSEPQATAMQFYSPPPLPPAPMGNDAMILQEVITASSEYGYTMGPMTAAQGGRLQSKLEALIRAGGSLSRSYAIHAAAVNNAIDIVEILLQMDPSIVNTKDDHCHTALMGAAQSAAGRNTKNGIAETKVIDILLAAGADKDIQDSMGMTAYGHFIKAKAGYDEMMRAMSGRHSSTPGRVHPTQLAVERKLSPLSGPTVADLNHGRSEELGFVKFE